jgi:6-phosphogluconolactonase (cycloisomerase 2 family)
MDLIITFINVSNDGKFVYVINKNKEFIRIFFKENVKKKKVYNNNQDLYFFLRK